MPTETPTASTETLRDYPRWLRAVVWAVVASVTVGAGWAETADADELETARAGGKVWIDENFSGGGWGGGWSDTSAARNTVKVGPGHRGCGIRVPIHPRRHFGTAAYHNLAGR